MFGDRTVWLPNKGFEGFSSENPARIQDWDGNELLSEADNIYCEG